MREIPAAACTTELTYKKAYCSGDSAAAENLVPPVEPLTSPQSGQKWDSCDASKQTLNIKETGKANRDNKSSFSVLFIVDQCSTGRTSTA